MPTAKEIVSKVHDLTALPGAYAKVRQLVEDPNSSPDHVARAIATDPAITARLLRLANSAFWGRRGRIETVTRAVRMLGMNHVHDLVLATSVTTALKGLDPGLFDIGRFWRASVYRALVAAALGTKRDMVDVERLFLEGLLSDIGHLVMYQSIPILAADADKHARARPWTLAEVETELIGCNYVEVGCVLAEQWLLPECFSQTIAYQNKPWASTTHGLEASFVYVARWLSHRLARRGDAIEQPAMPEAALHLVALPSAVIEEAAAEAETNLSAMVQLFTPALAAA
jgi:HD-like signal output (HDOD) protein